MKYENRIGSFFLGRIHWFIFLMCSFDGPFVFAPTSKMKNNRNCQSTVRVSILPVSYDNVYTHAY